MSDLPERPRLRPQIEPRPVTDRGEHLVILHDHWRLSPGNPVVLTLFGLALGELLNGSRTLEEIAAEFHKRYGREIEVEQVEALVKTLDDALLLDDERSLEAIKAWKAHPLREPVCAGGSYPGDARALTGFLEAQYTRKGGPGAPPDRARRGAPIRGLVSPHIDFHRGGHAYAHAWKALAEGCEAELFVIFGTAHAGTAQARFALTRKSYDTPLGTITTDTDLVDAIVRAYEGPDDLFQGEISHRGEHSIEFQAVELAHLYGERSQEPRRIRALPVLCGSIYDLNGWREGEKAQPRDPSGDVRVRTFHDALAKALAGIPPEKVCFVAGVDFAHVGRDFDDPPLTQKQLDAVMQKDKTTLEIVTASRDPDAFHRDVASDGDARRICGHSAIAALLEALRRSPRGVAGELLAHDAWYDGKSSVTFASAAFRDVSSGKRRNGAVR